MTRLPRRAAPGGWEPRIRASVPLQTMAAIDKGRPSTANDRLELTDRTGAAFLRLGRSRNDAARPGWLG